MADKSKIEIVTHKQLCAELKLDTYDAREKLRWALREPKKYPELAKGCMADPKDQAAKLAVLPRLQRLPL